MPNIFHRTSSSIVALLVLASTYLGSPTSADRLILPSKSQGDFYGPLRGGWHELDDFRLRILVSSVADDSRYCTEASPFIHKTHPPSLGDPAASSRRVRSYLDGMTTVNALALDGGVSGALRPPWSSTPS